MLRDAYTQVSESTYFLTGASPGVEQSRATAFAIAPGILVTVAHVLYKKRGESSSFQERIDVIRVPEVQPEQLFERATVIGLHSEYDIALVRIEEPRSDAHTAMTTAITVAADVGTIGFPDINPPGAVNPIPRFQGGRLSAQYSYPSKSGHWNAYYETDFPLYKGSSGAPGFGVDGKVFGIHVAELWSRDEDSLAQRAFSLWAPASAIGELAAQHHIAVQVL